MTPLAVAPARAVTSCPAVDGRDTYAGVGAVRPQPGNSSRIDTQGEQDGPGHGQGHDGAVAQQDVLGNLDPFTLDEQGVPQHGQHEGDDGQLQPQAVALHACGLVKGPQAV